MSESHGTHGKSSDEGIHHGMDVETSLTNQAIRALAIQQVLIAKEIIDTDSVRSLENQLRTRLPATGSRVVARAWINPHFKQLLLNNPKAALKEMGVDLYHDAELAVVENTDTIHHLVVCTLCSCYPIPLLGPPPDWYKSSAYRSRAVTEPRAVMREFGLELDLDIEVRILDSTADLRYLVLPKLPDGTKGMTESGLASLVTRDSMIGVAQPLSPGTII